MPSSTVHSASAQSWGGDACARLCQIIMESNHGIVQQIIDNRTDLLDILSIKQLQEPDDLGICAVFVAVYFDQPQAIRYLFRRGVDLSKPCDPMLFANPMFYAVSLRRHRLVYVLDECGCSVKLPCDRFKQTAIKHADRIDDQEMRDIITYCSGKEQRAMTLFIKNFLKSKQRRLYQKIRRGVIRLQSHVRTHFCCRHLGIARRKFVCQSTDEMVLELLGDIILELHVSGEDQGLDSFDEGKNGERVDEDSELDSAEEGQDLDSVEEGESTKIGDES